MKKELLFLLIVVVCSCGMNHKKENVQSNEQNERLIFPDSLVFHLPKNNQFQNSGCKEGIIASNAFENCKTRPSNEFVTEEFIPLFYLEEQIINQPSFCSSIIDSAKRNALKKMKVSDNSYFIIDKERKMLNKYNKDTLSHLFSEYANSLFVINFNCIYPSERNWVDSTTTCGLSEDFTLYFFKYGTSTILEKENPYDWELLPERIKHGYSCGVAISEEKLIALYWVLAW